MRNDKVDLSHRLFIKKFWKKLIKKLSPEQKAKIVVISLAPEKCYFCETTDIKWKNNTLSDYACDECVPRGCSCNLYKKTSRKDFVVEDYEYKLDESGNELPCEDWIKL